MKPINYTREDIISRTGEKLNLTHDEMKLILDTTLDTIAEMLTEEKSRIRIELRKFGVFEVKPTKAKPRARNPELMKKYMFHLEEKYILNPEKIFE